ncbi:MAG: hypothetical protein ABSB89_09075 [Candidatus Bathyarchaeia archaeon]
MRRKTKIEDMKPPHFQTILQILRYGVEILERKDWSEKKKISRAKHQFKDAMFRLGYTDDLFQTYRREPKIQEKEEKEEKEEDEEE